MPPRSPRPVEPPSAGPGQESVWDYPRPPDVVTDARRVRVVFGGLTICDTTDGVRVRETSHPPTWYLPRSAFVDVELRADPRTSWCEFKGRARYVTFDVPGRTERAVAWSYDDPPPAFEALRGRLALYPGRMDACWVGDEQVQAQEGDFYGGWITSDVVGPFKGGDGTLGW